MTEIKNIRIYNLKKAIEVSGYPMETGDPFEDDLDIDYLNYIKVDDLGEYDFSKLNKDDVRRAEKLGKAKSGSGHDSYLRQIQVTFDLKYPEYFSPELQRYHFLEIYSQSKMHRLCKMEIAKSTNKYVDKNIIGRLNQLIKKYNECEVVEKKYELFMKIVSNTPMGLEKWMHVSTNFAQLKTIYIQRKNHKLIEDWQKGFCDVIYKLPFFKEFCLRNEDE